MEVHEGIPDAQLFERLMELEDINKPWQSPERSAQIGREMSHIIFEQMFRYEQAHQKEVHNAV